jgi:tetratricopeptide (TPR) repeat protein
MLRSLDKLSVWLPVLALIWLAGCDQMITPRNAQLVKEADAKSAQGDFLWAINLYEAALDGTPESAEIHYKLALIYDDKMNDPLDALHHFKRYMALDPNGKHAGEIRGFIKHDEVALATRLSGDSVLTRAEATRLRNENLNLRKQLEERWSKGHNAPVEKSATHRSASRKAAKKHGGRTYVVKRGDTLASISRKFYKSSAHWKEILDANRKSIDDPDNLKVGQRLTIP